MKIKVGDQVVEGKVIEFSVIGEPWAEYQLADGNTARVKAVATRFIKLPEKNDDGTDEYILQSQTVLSVSPNE